MFVLSWCVCVRLFVRSELKHYDLVTSVVPPTAMESITVLIGDVKQLEAHYLGPQQQRLLELAEQAATLTSASRHYGA